MSAPKNFKFGPEENLDTSKAEVKKSQWDSAHTLVNRLPGVASNKGSNFAKLNKVVIQSLKELTDLIDDMKGNIIPRHEMLLTLHKVVGNLSAVIDINKIDLNDIESEDEEDDFQVPKEVQDWIQYTFMIQEENATNKRSSQKKIIQSKDFYKGFGGKLTIVPDIDPIPSEVVNLLESNKLWYFDIFELSEISKGHPLKIMFNYYLQKYNFFSTFRISPKIFNSFMNHIEFGYERNNNPYHNVLHGADVLNTLHTLMVLSTTMNILSSLEVFTSLFAATIHDYDHQGVTNNFIVDNKYQLALIYNDSSVQENHHVSAAFKLMKKPFLNLVSGMSTTQFNEFRSLCIKMVLATDMCQHFIQVKKFNNYVQTKEPIKIQDYLSILLHTADLSNPAKEWKTHMKWVVYIFREFFSQGDREKALGLTISPLCDRHAVHIHQSQIGFIDFIIQPTFDLFSNISEAILNQFHSKIQKESVLKRVKQTKGISNLIMQYKYCNNRPWETCIMENRSNWRRKQDKDYNELKGKMDTAEIKPKFNYEIELFNHVIY